MNEKILVTRSSMPEFSEYCEEIKKLWDSHWLTNMGEMHEDLTVKLQDYLECPHVVLFTNGHLALENVIASFNFPAGSEVITTPFTFASTTHAIFRNGLVPVFCDIKEDDYTIDPEKIEALITEKTRAIVPVHVYGNICDVERIGEIASAHGLKVIYDAAHAFGVKYRGISSANFGDASMFSFHATKVYNTVEGGAVCLQTDDLIQSLLDKRDFGIRGPEEVAGVGGNGKMNEFQAAMGLCNLRHIGEEIEKRKKAVERYRNNLSGVPGIKLNKVSADTEPNYAYFPVVFEGEEGTRDRIAKVLEENGIGARKYFYPLTNTFDCYKDMPGAGEEKTPSAAYVAKRVLTLPLYAGLSDEAVDRISEILTSL